MVEQDRCHDINAWEQRKLGDILSYEQPYEYIVSSDDYSPVARTPVLTAGKTLILGYTNEADGIKAVTKDSPVIIFDDFTASSHIIDYSFKIKSSAMKILSLRDSENDLYCIYYALTRIIRPSASHERQWISKYARATVTIPSKDEQQVIGDFLRKLDRLIAAEKRKLELLEKKREELLQCVFSQRLRLNGCTEDCPQYSLAELEMNGDIHMGRGKVISAIQMKKNPGIYPVYSSSSKNNGEMGRYGEYMFDHELVTWSIDGGGHVFYRAKHRFSITNVCGYIQVRNNIDCSFLAYQMMFKHSKLHFDYTSKALPSLIKNMYDLSMPSLYEQERIGRLFKVFDSLIEFISHKIELTEQKKKALLQTMFL
ncbi:restriction endonuclease subunit S [Bifidobacterium pseudolongum]|uniref:restriction endonuclease subunit S n=1 Tax=Bifidobacterium pseudolongum TaxID=1694 RepID=UPI001021F9D3|nr:restriction endonuclease subunit S [Bifidobacterium pseudolongum]